jgi:hypothetical protein
MYSKAQLFAYFAAFVVILSVCLVIIFVAVKRPQAATSSSPPAQSDLFSQISKPKQQKPERQENFTLQPAKCAPLDSDLSLDCPCSVVKRKEGRFPIDLPAPEEEAGPPEDSCFNSLKYSLQ